VGRHPCNPQAAPRAGFVALEVTVVEKGFVVDSHAARPVERDVCATGSARSPPSMQWRSRVGESAATTTAPASAGLTPITRRAAVCQRIEQARPGVRPVLDRDDREVGAVRLARRGVWSARPGRAEHEPGCDADHEKRSVSSACQGRSGCPTSLALPFSVPRPDRR